MAFQQRFDEGNLRITWYNGSGKRCVDDVRDGRQEDDKVFIKKRGENGIKFTRLGRCMWVRGRVRDTVRYVMHY